MDGVSLSLPARWVEKLQQVPGLIVTPDAMVQGLRNREPPVEPALALRVGQQPLWLGDQAYYSGKTPAIAIVDSGVQKSAPTSVRV